MAESTQRVASLRFVLVVLVGCALVFFLWRFFQLDEGMTRLFLPPPEVR